MSHRTLLIDTLARWGGALSRPRATFAALPPDASYRDGAVFLFLYAVGAHLLPLGDALADFSAMASLAALPTLLSGCIVLIPWLVATLGIEAILGPARAHRAALCLAPMLLLTAAARLLTALAHPLPPYAADILGALLAAALALRVRSAIRLSEETPPSETPPGVPSPPRPSALLLGLGLLALPLASATRDALDLAQHWHSLAPLGVGADAPDFHANDLDGRSFTAQDLRGGTRLLVFWTSWCRVCQTEMPTYAALHRELAAQGFEVIGINCDRDDDQQAIARRYRQDNGLPFRLVLDHGALASAFRLSVYPHLVLVDRTGQIRWVHQGRALESTLRAAIADASSP